MAPRLRIPQALAPLAPLLVAALLLALVSAGCSDCNRGGEPAARADRPAAELNAACPEPLYGDPHLKALYDVHAAGEPALLTADVDALLEAGPTLIPLLDEARAVSLVGIPRVAREVVLADAWGAAARLQRGAVSSPARESLTRALGALMRHLAIQPDEALRNHRPPPAALAIVPVEDGWAEFDTEHSVLTHERVFGLRRVFRIFVRGDHEARALVSQLIAIDANGDAYLTSVVGEVEMLELDADGPTGARVWRLDRQHLGCGDVMLEEDSEVQRIPDIGADGFILDLPAPESLATMPCARCHEDADAFSLPTTRTAVADRLTPLLTRAGRNARAISLVSEGPVSAP